MSNRPRGNCVFVCICVCVCVPLVKGVFPIPYWSNNQTVIPVETVHKYAVKTEKSRNPDAVYLIAGLLFI